MKQKWRWLEYSNRWQSGDQYREMQGHRWCRVPRSWYGQHVVLAINDWSGLYGGRRPIKGKRVRTATNKRSHATAKRRSRRVR